MHKVADGDEGIDDEAGDRPEVRPLSHHPPFIPTTHPTTTQGHPHLPKPQSMGVLSSTPFIHPHHRPSQLSLDARGRSQPALGSINRSLAGLDRPVPPQTFAAKIRHFALFHPQLQARGGGEAPNRHHRPGILTQVRLNRSRLGLLRSCGTEAGLLLFGILLSTVKTLTFPFSHPLLQVLGGKEAPHRGCRPEIWTMM